MRKVCPQCEGKGTVQVNLMGLPIDASCYDCNMTGYIDVPDDTNEEPKETAETDDQ